MKLEDYAWNRHEQKMKAAQTEFAHSEPKIKITDNIELRNKIEETLERMPQKTLAQWALRVSVSYLDFLDDPLKEDPRIELGMETLRKRIDGTIGAFDLRKVGWIVQGLAKESTSDVSKYSARSFAHAIATGHMRGHALVCSDYAMRATNLLTDDDLDSSTKERRRQLEIAEELSGSSR